MAASIEQATVAEVIAAVDMPAPGWQARATDALAVEESQPAPRKTLLAQLRSILSPAEHVDGQLAPLDAYPDRPFHEAVDARAFPDGLPPGALPPTTAEES